MLPDKLKNLETEVRNYAATVYPGMAGKKALRFIDDNFRNQSWEGQPWKKRKRGDRGRALLVQRGILRRGNRMQLQVGQARIFNDVPYAKAHNEGFRGTVSIGAHNRRRFGKYASSSLKTRKTSIKKQYAGDSNVKGHSRKMNIPRRQFMPTASRPSPTLTREVQRQITLDIYKILKSS